MRSGISCAIWAHRTSCSPSPLLPAYSTARQTKRNLAFPTAASIPFCSGEKRVYMNGRLWKSCITLPNIRGICPFFIQGGNSLKVNDHLLNLSDSYLFSAIGQKVKEYRLKNPDCKIISLGIGDVTRPLVDEVVRS